MDLKERYLRNMLALSAEDVEKLHTKKVCIIGSGGLGGYILENLARIGILHITIVDFDVFEASNLNRQLLSTESVMGIPKTEVAVRRVNTVNSQVKITGLQMKFDETNGEDILKGHDIVMDALDSISTRLLLAEICRKLNIPLVHGSIGGWYGQVACVFPGDKTLEKIYNTATEDRGIEKNLGNLPFTAAMIASLQCAECIKILTGKGDVLRNSVLHADLLHNEFYNMAIEKDAYQF